MLNKLLTASIITTVSVSTNAATVTFDDLGLGTDSVYFPGPNAGLAAPDNINFIYDSETYTVNSGGATFSHTFTNFGDFGDGPCCWSGLTYSSKSSEVDATGASSAPAT